MGYKPVQLRAFTLIELAIVLVVVSLMAGFGLKAVQSTGSVSCYDKTRIQMRDISASLQNYVRTNSKYPIPARINVGVTDTTFGKADDGTHIDDNADAHTVYIGALPFATLGLSPTYAADCWGNKFSYLVTKTLTTGIAGAGVINVRTGSLSSHSDLSTQAAYAVISHGANAQISGFGACARNYSNASTAACNCNAAEISGAITRVDKENCDTNNAVVYSTTFNNGASAPNLYDDILIYKEKAATLASNCVPADITWLTNCGAPVSQLNDGATSALSNSIFGYAGTATVQCSNGTLSVLGAPAPTCAGSCPIAASVNWVASSNTCTDSSVSTDCGGLTVIAGSPCTLHNVTAGRTGSETATCSAGTLSYSSLSCGLDCTGAATTWLTNCAGSYATLAGNGGAATVTNTNGGYGGSETATCTNGVVTFSGAVCTANGVCGTANGTDMVSMPSTPGQKCSTGAASAISGTGPWTWTCGTAPGSIASCTAYKICASAAQPWLTHCTATPTAGNHNTTQSLTNTASGYSGTATATCDPVGSGTWALSATVCNANCVAIPQPPGVTWLANCNANVLAANDGGVQSINNTVASYTGSETATCNNGTFSYSSPICAINGVCGTADGTDVTVKPSGGVLCNAGAASAVAGSGPWTWTCGAAPGTVADCTAYKQCPIKALTWNTNCSGSSTVGNHNSSQAVNNTAANYNGTDNIQCDPAGGGTWSVVSHSCALNGCAAIPSTSWLTHCSGNVPALAAGGTNSINNTAAGYTGSETATCNATGTGVVAYSAPVCNVAPSDIRLKEGIEYVGRVNGYNYYEFSYKSDPAHHRYRGVMAQEVMKVPGAVITMSNGYYAVDYSVLGVPFVQVQ